MLNNRQQSGRRRGRGGQRQQGGNGRDNGNRIDNRARGNAPQMLEKYKTLARDSQLSGDRVMTEYYLQFADHYFRVVAESRARFEENRRQRDDWQGEEGYEGEEQSLDQGAENYGDAENFGGQDEDRTQQQQPRREVRERNDREGNRDNNRERNPRDGNRQRYANDRNGNAFNGNRAREEEDERPESGGIDIAVLPPAFASDGPITPIDIDEPEPTAAPRRRGRPRKAVPEAEAGSEG